MIKHATISAWQREEDGSYKATIGEVELHVTWRKATEGERRGFLWTATGPNDKARTAEGPHEEIELAMAEAEEVAKTMSPAEAGDAKKPKNEDAA